MGTTANDFGHWLRVNGSGGAGSSFTYRERTVRGSNPSAAKARLYGTNGKLGRGGVIGSTASQYTRRISRSAESQAMSSMASADRALSRLMADADWSF